MHEEAITIIDVILDLGLPLEVLATIKKFEKFEPLLDTVFKKARELPKSISLIKSSSLGEVEEVNEHSHELIMVLELHSGISIGPYNQIDSEGDEVGSLCPTRGRDQLRKMVLKMAKKFKGVVIDLCDFFFYSTEGSTSCLCRSCLKELRRKIEGDMEEFMSGSEFKLSVDEVLEEVEDGRAILAGVLRKDEDGWVAPVIKGRSFVEVVKKLETKGYDGFEKFKSIDDFRRALASLILFMRARSELVADCVMDAFKDLNCYKAVVLEGGLRTGPLSPLPTKIASKLLSDGIDIWMDGELEGARYYNLRRSRYLVGQFNEALFIALSLIEHDHVEEMKVKPTIIRGRSSRGILTKALLELPERWLRLMNTLKVSWIPSPQEVRELGLKCTVFGWPKEIVDLLRLIVKSIIEDYEELIEEEEAKSIFEQALLKAFKQSYEEDSKDFTKRGSYSPQENQDAEED